MTWLTDGVMQAVLLSAVWIVACTLVSLIAQRAMRHRRRRRRALLDQRIRPLVLTATVCDEDELPELLQRVHRLDHAEQSRVRRTVLGMLRDVTGEAAERLRAIGDAAGLVPRALADVEHRDAATRADVAEALGLLRPPGALRLLRELAADRSPEVRAVAIRALGAFSEPVATELIVAALALDSGVPNSVAASALLQQGLTAGEAYAGRSTIPTPASATARPEWPACSRCPAPARPSRGCCTMTTSLCAWPRSARWSDCRCALRSRHCSTPHWPTAWRARWPPRRSPRCRPRGRPTPSPGSARRARPPRAVRPDSPGG